MKVSVAIPCYNGSAYIGDSLQSVLAQSRPADEILVVDDGSTDDSAAIIRRYPVSLLSHAQNKGLSAARNTALGAAAGDILLYIDVDALAAPNLLDVLLAAYTPDAQLAGVGGQGIESNIRSLADRWRRAHASQGHGPRAKNAPFLFGLCMSFRVKALQQVGGFNETFRTNAEDMDIGLRLTQAGFYLRYLPEAQVFHQRSDDVASLKRAMMAWYSGAYRAKQRNQAQAWRLFAKTAQRIITDPLQDVFILRDPALAPLSVVLGFAKLQALWQTF